MKSTRVSYLSTPLGDDGTPVLAVFTQGEENSAPNKKGNVDLVREGKYGQIFARQVITQLASLLRHGRKYIR